MADKDKPETVPEVPEISSLPDDQLATLAERLTSEIRAAGEDPAAADVEELESLVDGLEQVRAEQGTRAEAAAARAARVAELIGRVEEPATEPEEPEPAEEPTGPASEPQAVTPAAEPTVEPAAEPVAAAAPAAAVPAKPKPSMAAIAARIGKPALPPRPTSGLAIVAAGDVAGFSAGSHIPDAYQLGKAWAEKAGALMGSRARGRFPVARLQADYPAERRLSSVDPIRSQELIQAVVAPEAITAAGGLCAPVNVSYDLANVSVTDRPIRDSLPRFMADRGGIRYVAPPTLAGLAGAVDVITEAEDAAATTKSCLTITCGTDTERAVSAIYQCLEVGNFNRKFFPEQFQTWWALAAARLAREAETELFDQMCTLSTAVTTGQVLGTARDVLENVHQAGAAYRSRHRMRWETPLRMVAPGWLRNMMAADVIRQQPGDNTLGVTYAMIDGWIRAAGINPTWDLDTDPFGAEAGGGLNPWPSTVEVLLFHEGAFLYLDGGTLDFGVEIRDTTMISENNVQAFLEVFENVALVGVESLCITMDVCPSGASSLPETISDTVCTGS